MTSTPSSPASAKCAAPRSISPSPRARKRLKPSDCFRVPRSFDVLYLLTQFFDLRFDLKSDSRNGERFALHAGRFRKHRVRFAMHFLQQKVQLLTQLTRTIQQFAEL